LTISTEILSIKKVIPKSDIFYDKELFGNGGGKWPVSAVGKGLSQQRKSVNIKSRKRC
jgi:hypothetical protein